LQEIYLDYSKKYYGTIDNKRYFYNKTDKAYEKLVMNTNISFNDIYFPQKSQVIQLLDKLLKGDLKKLSLLLHGIPGAGKSSIIKAISSYTGYNIIEVKLALIADDNELKSLFFNPLLKVQTGDSAKFVDVPLNKRIFILEDVDADHNVVNTRTPTDVKLDKLLETSSIKPKLTLSGVLNTLDGVLEINGSIIVMTTNHPDKLDPALIRSGRVTLNVELSTMTSEDAKLLIQKYYPEWHIDIPDKLYIPADLENYCQMSSSQNELIKLLNI
jgi:SpoVK/Ycf46/Vps4 family AAA+-type ATPase